MVEDMETTAEQIRTNLSDDAVVEESILHESGLHVVVPDSDVGLFFREVRKAGIEADTVRDGNELRGFLTPSGE